MMRIQLQKKIAYTLPFLFLLASLTQAAVVTWPFGTYQYDAWDESFNMRPAESGIACSVHDIHGTGDTYYGYILRSRQVLQIDITEEEADSAGDEDYYIVNYFQYTNSRFQSIKSSPPTYRYSGSSENINLDHGANELKFQSVTIIGETDACIRVDRSYGRGDIYEGGHSFYETIPEKYEFDLRGENEEYDYEKTDDWWDLDEDQNLQ